VTRHHRTGRALALTAVLLGAGAIRLGVTDHWIAAAALAYGTLLAALGACLERRAHRRILAQHERARRRARGEAPLAPLDPCCAFWIASAGAAHGRGCTRSAPENIVHSGQEHQASALHEVDDSEVHPSTRYSWPCTPATDPVGLITTDFPVSPEDVEAIRTAGFAPGTHLTRDMIDAALLRQVERRPVPPTGQPQNGGR
jgi:hypothetical protein